ncbi:MAG: hypothetical protein IJR49_02500, partial [Treponema sp.]|nr:hypothetical protein [Treponema sp.]
MKNNTLRGRLAFTFSSTVAGIALICSYIIIVVSLIVISVTNSYQSNEFLNDYISTLLSMEKSLSSYMDVRSFESIDEYYTYRSELEDLTLLLYQRPSNQEELLLEYKIMRMAHSFVAYSDRALASRRANRFIQADEQYSLAQKTYQHLFNSLSQLNQLYFSKNHETY